MADPKTDTLDVPGAVLTYDVRNMDSASTAPPLVMIGSPMGAAGFGTLARRFTDRIVVTYDPRGVERGRRTDGATESPDEHADDVHRLISALDLGPVDLLASSGGAVNALVLIARHPEQVRVLVAHESPAAQVLPDREEALAAAWGIRETYQRSGLGPAMAKFIALVSHKGAVPADFAAQPALPTEDDGSRDDPLIGQNIISCPHDEHDFDALRRAATRIVIAAGVESAGEMAHRGALAAAERLGTTAVMFPDGHGGFLGGEYGQMGDPDGFAVMLRQVLDGLS